MKILYYSSHPHITSTSPSGSGRHVREMILAFKNEGHEVRQLIMGDDLEELSSDNKKDKGNNSLKSKLRKKVPKVVKTFFRDRQMLNLDRFFKDKLEDEVRRFEPDLIYERAIYLMSAGTEIAQKYSIKHVWEVNSPLLEEKLYMQGKSVFNNKIKNIEAVNFYNTNLAVFISSALEKYYLGNYPFLKEKSMVTPNGVNIDDLKIEGQQEVKKHLGISNEQVIGFVGSIFPYHGVDILLKAFAQVKQKSGNIKLVVVGDGEILPELQSLATDLKVENDVIFTGSVNNDEVFKYIDIFDVAVMVKSNWYGSPVKIFEYGGMKKAIIAPHQPPVNEVMQNGVDGLIVDDNIEEIGQAIIDLLTNPSKKHKLAESFHDKVIQKYNWNTNANRVLKTLKQIE